MTNKQRAALLELMERQTRLKTASKEVAREFLVRQGICTEDGVLTPEYGGPDRSAPANPEADSKRA